MCAIIIRMARTKQTARRSTGMAPRLAGACASLHAIQSDPQKEKMYLDLVKEDKLRVKEEKRAKDEKSAKEVKRRLTDITHVHHRPNHQMTLKMCKTLYMKMKLVKHINVCNRNDNHASHRQVIDKLTQCIDRVARKHKKTSEPALNDDEVNDFYREVIARMY